MPQKVIETFFRHKFLVLLPLVVLVALGVAAASTKQSDDYSTSAKVWTQRTALIRSSLGGQGSFFTTPADHQARVIRDLMSLASFRTAVASKVDGLAGLPEGLQREAVGEGTHVFSSGINVLTIRHIDEDPVLARDIVNAVIETYSETFREGVLSEAAAAEEFYEERLEEVGTELEEAKAALATYQGTESPDLSPDTAVDDPEMASLISDVNEAEEEYNTYLDRLESVYIERDAALKGRNLSFQVMDPPGVPSAPVPTPMKDLLMYPMIGLLLGISASGIVLFGLTRLDDSIRLPEEVRQRGVPVLAVVPELGRKRLKVWPQHFVRQVVAGTRGLLG